MPSEAGGHCSGLRPVQSGSLDNIVERPAVTRLSKAPAGPSRLAENRIAICLRFDSPVAPDQASDTPPGFLQSHFPAI